MEGFGQRVMTARSTLGWTRRELARRAGLHEQHLANVERGNRFRIEAETILKLARALGCSTDYLMGLIEDPTPAKKRPRSPQGCVGGLGETHGTTGRAHNLL
jgi:transcriptional regulator with XRE-family HTH domain